MSLVIPGRDCAATVRPCLQAAVTILRDGASRLDEIIFVDDGSRDGTAGIVADFPEVTRLTGAGGGPAAARNLGWRAAKSPLVWFVDSDCVADPAALRHLLPHLDDPRVGGASGTYANANPHSLLACLIHEEIRERHRHSQGPVDFLATFDVLYRRDLLERLGGFDVRYKKAQDAELAMRAVESGAELRLENASVVAHFHETRWLAYLRTQLRQGFWRVYLHLERRGHAAGDSYSRLSDHLQPPLAMAVLGTLPLAVLPWLRLVPAAAAVLLLFLQLPMTAALVRRTGEGRFLLFGAMSFVRAFWRGAGMTLGVVDYAWSRTRRRRRVRDGGG